MGEGEGLGLFLTTDLSRPIWGPLNLMPSETIWGKSVNFKPRQFISDVWNASSPPRPLYFSVTWDVGTWTIPEGTQIKVKDGMQSLLSE